MLTIQISLKNNKALSINIGNKGPQCSQVYWITVVREEYNENREVVYATMIWKFWEFKKYKIQRKKLEKIKR